MIKPEKLVSLLNKFVEISSDRADGYKVASEKSKDPDLKILFAQFQQTSINCKSQIIAEIHKLRRIPIQGIKTSGSFYNVWSELSDASFMVNRIAILTACLKGERPGNNIYQYALESISNQLPPNIQLVIYSQYEQIKSECDEVRILLDMTEEQN
jgi:uncharacterized protein (TIGR02284 family)